MVSLALLLALAVPCQAATTPAAPGATVTGASQGRLDLSKGWVFHLDPGNIGPAGVWQRPDLDDSKWRPIRVDAPYEAQGITYDGYSWYRLHFQVPAGWANQGALLDLGPVDDADQTFLNGRLVGHTGDMGSMTTTAWTQERLYVLKPGALKTGENVLAVRVWDQRGNGGIYRGPVYLVRLKSGATEVEAVDKEPWGVELGLADGVRVRLEVYGDDAVRVRAVPVGHFRHWLADSLIPAVPEPSRASFGLRQTANSLLLVLPKLRVTVNLRPYRLDFADGEGKPLTSEATGPWWSGGWLGDALTCGADEHFLGLGEPGPHIDRRGQTRDLWVIHSYQAEDIPVPFVISSKGYGVLFCNSFRGQFDVASSQPDLIQFRASGGEVDYFVMGGPTPKDVISAYTSITGRSPMPPRWAFGYWQSRAGYGAQAWAIALAERLRKDGFPLDVIHMDGWSDGDLKFSAKRFPDPQGFLNRLRAMGVKVCIWETPFVNPKWKMFRVGLDKGYFAQKPGGGYYPVTAWVGTKLGLIDFLNPAACRWWADAHKPVLDMGVAAVKTDGGDTHEVPADAIFYGGHTGAEVHNLYPLLFNRCVYDGQQRLRPGLRVINWTRTGYAGIQRYPCTWGGDEPSTFVGGRTLVRAGINAGVCGIAFWSHDLGGFADGRTREYYVRSCEWGFLSPLSRIHGIAGGGAEPGITGNEPWVYGPATEAIIRKYVRLRYRLLPYLYTYAHVANETGVPIMRALPLEFPADARGYACDYQYMLGAEMMVAPIVEPSGRRDLTAVRQVYLPAGEWYDYWTDKVLRGPAEVMYTAPLDTLPVFVRAGAVIPYGPKVDYIAGPPPAALTVDVYAGADGSFDLTEDDGLTLKYRDGEIARTLIRQHEAEAGGRRTITVDMGAPRGHYDGMPKVRPVTFRFHGVDAAGASAQVDGKAAKVSRDEAGRLVVGPVQAEGAVRVRLEG